MTTEESINSVDLVHNDYGHVGVEMYCPLPVLFAKLCLKY